MKVYLLEHLRVEDDPETYKLIGIFSSYIKAEEAIEILKQKPGFKDHPEGFNIDWYEVDRMFWESGFGSETEI